MTKVNKLSVGGTTVVETYTKQIALAYNLVEDDNDKIRCRNGNLEITVSKQETTVTEL